jgi:hypothetical protein
VDNNPLKYIDPTGHVKVIPAGLGFVFTSNDGSTTIRIIMFVTESLGFAAQFQGVGL